MCLAAHVKKKLYILLCYGYYAMQQTGTYANVSSIPCHIWIQPSSLCGASTVCYGHQTMCIKWCEVCVALNNWIVCSILIYRPQGENGRKKNVSFKITGKLKKSRVGISLRPRQVWTEVDLKSCIEDQNPALTQTPEKLKVKVFLALLRCLVYASQRLLAHSLGLLPLNH